MTEYKQIASLRPHKLSKTRMNMGNLTMWRTFHSHRLHTPDGMVKVV